MEFPDIPDRHLPYIPPTKLADPLSRGGKEGGPTLPTNLHRLTRVARPLTREVTRVKKEKLPNEASFPHWRYQKRRCAQQTNPTKATWRYRKRGSADQSDPTKPTSNPCQAHSASLQRSASPIAGRHSQHPLERLPAHPLGPPLTHPPLGDRRSGIGPTQRLAFLRALASARSGQGHGSVTVLQIPLDAKNSVANFASGAFSPFGCSRHAASSVPIPPLFFALDPQTGLSGFFANLLSILTGVDALLC